MARAIKLSIDFELVPDFSQRPLWSGRVPLHEFFDPADAKRLGIRIFIIEGQGWLISTLYLDDVLQLRQAVFDALLELEKSSSCIIYDVNFYLISVS